MSSSYRPNRHIAPSLRGERSIDAAEQRAREQNRRENAEAAARRVAEFLRNKTNLAAVKHRSKTRTN